MEALRLRLVELTVAGTGVPDASVRFAPGLNLIVGASDTGKTFVFEAIDFMLGAGTPLRRFPESKDYDRVFLAIDPTGRPPFTLQRAFAGGHFEATEFENGREMPPTATKALKAQHSPDAESSLSPYLLRAIGMQGRQVRRNKEGDKRALSFRDVAHLTLIDEERVIQKASPVVSGQYTLKTGERNVFAYFLTGQDDSQVIPHESTADTKARLDAEASVVESILGEKQSELCGLSANPEELPAQVERLEHAIEEASQALVAAQDSIKEVAEKRSDLFQEANKIRSKIIFLGEQLKRLRLLNAFYDSDRERLEGVIEASRVVHEMPKGTCPLCNQALPDAAEKGSHQAFEEACVREIEKIDALRRDLRITATDYAAEEQRLQGEVSRLNREVGEADERLRRELAPSLGEARTQWQELIRKRTLLAQGESLWATVRGLEDRLKRIEAEKKSGEPQTAFADRATTGVAAEFCRVVEGILKAWKYPNLGSVVFDTDKADLVIGDQDRNTKGKGYRAITYAAFSIGLMKYCRMKGIPHPGFVVLDTPINPYKGPAPKAGELIVDEMKAAFYEYLAADNSGDQFIIMENEPPPEAVKANANYIHFSKNPEVDRYGFFPHIPVTGIEGAPAAAPAAAPAPEVSE